MLCLSPNLYILEHFGSQTGQDLNNKGGKYQHIHLPCSGGADGHDQVGSGGVYGQEDADDRSQLLGIPHQELGRAPGMGALGTTGIPSQPYTGFLRTGKTDHFG